MAGVLEKLGDFAERAGTVYANLETLKYNQRIGQGGTGNLSTDHGHIDSGVANDGSTILAGQIISGVDNHHFLLGLGGFLGLIAVGVALAYD